MGIVFKPTEKHGASPVLFIDSSRYQSAYTGDKRLSVRTLRASTYSTISALLTSGPSNYTIGDDITAAISMSLSNVTLEEALAKLLEISAHLNRPIDQRIDDGVYMFTLQRKQR